MGVVSSLKSLTKTTFWKWKESAHAQGCGNHDFGFGPGRRSRRDHDLHQLTEVKTKNINLFFRKGTK